MAAVRVVDDTVLRPLSIFKTSDSALPLCSDFVGNCDTSSRSLSRLNPDGTVGDAVAGTLGAVLVEACVGGALALGSCSVSIDSRLESVIDSTSLTSELSTVDTDNDDELLI